MTRAVESHPQAAEAPSRGLGRLLAFLLLPVSAAFAGINGIQQILVPGQVEALDPANKIASLALLTTLAAITSMVGIPAGGALSDRTRSRYGRRAPWLVGLSIVSGALMIGMGASGSILMLGLAYALLWLTVNMYQGALFAVLPDRVPEARRGFASAIIGLGTPIGVLIGVNIASHLPPSTGYLISALLLVVASLVFVLGAREESSTNLPLVLGKRDSGVSPWEKASGFFEAFRERDFALAFASRFMLFLSYFTVSGYLFYTLSDYIGIDQVPDGNIPVAVSTLLSISVITWVFVATFCGWLADKLDRRKLFVGISALGLGATMFVPILSPTWTGMVIYSVLAGAFIGTYFAVDLAVMSLVLPHKDSEGRDLGILGVATGLPQIMSSALAGALITYAGGYTALYLFGTLSAIAAGVIVLFIRKVR